MDIWKSNQKEHQKMIVRAQAGEHEIGWTGRLKAQEIDNPRRTQKKMAAATRGSMFEINQDGAAANIVFDVCGLHNLTR